jgi:hypothetical protein
VDVLRCHGLRPADHGRQHRPSLHGRDQAYARSWVRAPSASDRSRLPPHHHPPPSRQRRRQLEPLRRRPQQPVTGQPVPAHHSRQTNTRGCQYHVGHPVSARRRSAVCPVSPKAANVSPRLQVILRTSELVCESSHDSLQILGVRAILDLERDAASAELDRFQVGREP